MARSRRAGLLVLLCAFATEAKAQSAPADSNAIASACATTSAVRPARCALVSPRSPLGHKPWRTTLELGAVYGGAVFAYYGDGRARRIDRDVLDGLGKIFSPDRIRFDDNLFDLNNLSHPLGGLIYYGIPRANGATATRSFLTLFAASAFWEQVVELQEIASLNDHIGTPISGWVLGESLFQARALFQRSQPTWSHRLVQTALGVPVVFSEAVRARPAPARGPVDNHGVADDVEHDVAFYLGISDRKSPPEYLSGIHTEFGLETEIHNTGRRDLADHRSGWLKGTVSSALTIAVSFQDGTLNEVRAFAKVLPAGWYRHDVRPDDDANGYTLLIGPSGAFELDMLGDDHKLYMQRIAAYMLGATLDAELLRGHWRARGVVDAFANFAQAGSTGRHAHPDWWEYTDDGSPMRVNGYYNAFGPTLNARASLAWRAARLQTEARLHRLGLIETTALDRNPDNATNIRAKSDDWTTLSAQLALRPVHNLEVVLQRQQRTWVGSIEDVRTRKVERAWWLRLNAVF
jgi:hypothetical protein